MGIVWWFAGAIGEYILYKYLDSPGTGGPPAAAGGGGGGGIGSDCTGCYNNIGQHPY